MREAGLAGSIRLCGPLLAGFACFRVTSSRAVSLCILHNRNMNSGIARKRKGASRHLPNRVEESVTVIPGLELRFQAAALYRRMTRAPENLTPATSEEIADAIAFALRHSGRKRVHDSSEMMAAIVAKRLGTASGAFRFRRHEAAAAERQRADAANVAALAEGGCRSAPFSEHQRGGTRALATYGGAHAATAKRLRRCSS